MDTRLLYTIALVIASVVGGFYYYSGKSHKLHSNANQNLNSTAKNIKVVQTTENGQLYAKVNATQMIQAMQSGHTATDNITGTLFQNGIAYAVFNADKSISENDFVDVKLLGNVVVSKLGDADVPSITFKTDQIMGNTKTNQIETKYPVLVYSRQAQFTSQGLTANLNTGQYEFYTIRGRYAPSTP